MFEQGAPDRRDHTVVDILREIDASDLGAECPGWQADLKIRVGHRPMMF